MKLPEKCRVCPRKCNVNRLKNEEGFCRTGYFSRVYSFFAHHGEESVLSGTQGSGVIFFSMCNMSCVFCQNHKFSQKKSGREVSFDELADMMLALQEQGCQQELQRHAREDGPPGKLAPVFAQRPGEAKQQNGA